MASFDTLVGNPNASIEISNTTIGYPHSNVVDVFGQIYLPRVYGKDLTTFEIASSGNISLSLLDAHSLDIGMLASNVLINPVQGKGLVLSDSSLNNSIRLGSNIALCATSNCSITIDDQNISIIAPNDYTVYAKNDIVLKANSLIIDVENLSLSYAFQVNPTGALQLIQNMTENGSKVARVVATFGYNKVL